MGGDSTELKRMPVCAPSSSKPNLHGVFPPGCLVQLVDLPGCWVVDEIAVTYGSKIDRGNFNSATFTQVKPADVFCYEVSDLGNLDSCSQQAGHDEIELYVQPKPLTELERAVLAVLTANPGMGAAKVHRAVEAALPSSGHVSDKRMRRLVREAKAKLEVVNVGALAAGHLADLSLGNSRADSRATSRAAEEPTPKASPGPAAGPSIKSVLALGVHGYARESLFKGLECAEYSVSASGLRER